MFAFLALAGDLGAMVSPSMVGTLSEMSGGNLKAGLLAATIFPIVLVFVLLITPICFMKNIFHNTEDSYQ